MSERTLLTSTLTLIPLEKVFSYYTDLCNEALGRFLQFYTFKFFLSRRHYIDSGKQRSATLTNSSNAELVNVNFCEWKSESPQCLLVVSGSQSLMSGLFRFLELLAKFGEAPQFFNIALLF